MRNGHRVVIEVSVDGVEAWTAILNNTENLGRAFGHDSETELVCHGKGIGLVRKDSPLGDRVRQLASSTVRFVACQNTMRKLNLSERDLLAGVGTVDAGVAEVVRKQEAEWAYLKGGF